MWLSIFKDKYIIVQIDLWPPTDTAAELQIYNVKRSQNHAMLIPRL